MALSIVQEPAAVGLAKNEMWLVLQTDNLVTTAGVKALWVLNFSGNPAANDTIQFEWDGNDITLTFKASPDDSGLQLPTNGGALPLADYLNILVVAFRANFLLNEYFNITSGSGAISGEGRETGTAYNATITESVTNMTTGSGTAGVDEAQEANFQILLDVYLEETFGSGTYARVAKLEADPDEANQVQVNIAETVLPYLASDRPAIGASITRCSNICKSYYYRYAESYGSTAVAKYLYNGSFASKLALLAGLKFDKFPGNTFLADYVTGTTNRKFLTLQPRTKQISLTQKEWLYFFCSETDAAMKVYAKIYYSDLSNSTQEIYSVSSPAYAPYIIPTGYDDLDLGSYAPAKTVDSYEIWVEKVGPGRRSEIFTYELDRTAYPNNTYLLFQNSLGGMDTVWFTGEQMQGIELDPMVTRKYVNRGYAATDAEYQEDQNEYFDKVTVSTGYKDEDYIQYLRDLFLSNEVYDITPDGFRAILIDRDKIKLFDTDDDLHGLEINYRYAYNNASAE